MADHVTNVRIQRVLVFQDIAVDECYVVAVLNSFSSQR